VSQDPRFFLDAGTGLAQEHDAVVYAPRRVRNRFQANCVQLCDSADDARSRADATRGLYAARVIGPSKSSEGFMMYYLVRWLE
jgi:hypothetical protein